MGGKSVINFVLILVLVVAINQVEAKKNSCCDTTLKRHCYNTCRFIGKSQESCASLCGCSPDGYSTPPNSEEEEAAAQEFVVDYCKFKCASSICNIILHASAEKEPCYNACSHFCKDSKTAVVTNVA